jgi:hypothetical protein
MTRYRYLTISETIRENGDRHAANARRHMAEGRPEYAAGSMRKAERNWLRAKEFECPPNPVADAFVRAIVDRLYQGDPNVPRGGLHELISRSP